MLVQRVAKKWDAEVVKKIKQLRQRPARRGRKPWVQLTLEDAARKARDEVSGTRYGLGPRPKELSHLDFRVGIVRGLLGLPVVSFGTRPRGRKRKTEATTSSSSSVLSTPDRKKAKSAAAAAAFSSTGKRQYPRRRVHKAGQGLDPCRFDGANLEMHRPYPLGEKEIGEDIIQNRHRCQICSAVGKQWKDDDGK